MELALLFVKVHDVEAVGLFGTGVRNTKVKPVSMTIGGRIHVEVEVIFKLVNLDGLHQVTSFKPTLKYQGLVLLVFKLIKLRQLRIKPVELNSIAGVIILRAFFAAMTHHSLRFVNVPAPPVLWRIVGIINQHLFSYERAQMVPQVFNQDILVFKTEILCQWLCFWAFLVVVWSGGQKWLVYACFRQRFVDVINWNTITLVLLFDLLLLFRFGNWFGC